MSDEALRVGVGREQAAESVGIEGGGPCRAEWEWQLGNDCASRSMCKPIHPCHSATRTCWAAR